MVLCVLAACNSGRTEYYELGCGHVLRSHHLVVGVLFHLGETRLCWAGHGGETRVLGTQPLPKYTKSLSQKMCVTARNLAALKVMEYIGWQESTPQM